MSELFTKSFWVSVLERGIRTFAWTAAGLLGATGIDKATDASNIAVDAKGLLISSGIAALASMLFSIGVAKTTDGSPALNKNEKIVK